MNAATVDLPSIESAPLKTPVARRVMCALATLLALGSFTSALFLGWGWDDLLQLFSHPARATLLVALMIQLAFAVTHVRFRAHSVERAGGYVGRTIFWLFVAGGLLIVASSAFWDRRILFVLPGEDLTRYVGLGLFLMGLASNAWPRNPLERWQNAVLIAGRRPQGNGPLMLCRSIQLGLMLAVIGLPMVFLSQLGLAGGVFLVVVMAVRVKWAVGAAVSNARVLEQRLQAAWRLP